AVTFAERCVANNKVVWRVANLGLAHYRAGQLDHAASALKESLAINPLWNPPWIHSVLAMVQHRLGDSEKASAALDKRRSAREERVELMLAGDVGYWPVPWWDFLHGELLYNEAYALIHGSPPPEDWRLLIHRGRALEAIGRADEARAVFARAFELQPDELLYRVRRLPHVSRTEAYAQGVADLRTFLKEHPDQPEPGRLALSGILLQWGVREWNAGRRQEAEAALADAADAAPQNARLRSQRGQVWFSFNEFEKAIADYSLALELIVDAP